MNAKRRSSASAAGSLDEKYVVGVDVRPDAAAGRGVAHHHVIETGLRHEGKAPQQFIGGGDMVVHAVHEQRPVLRSRLYPGERPVHRFPPIAAALHDAGLDIIPARERREAALVDEIGRGDCALHDKWALLPMSRKEFARSQAAEQSPIHRGDYM